MGNSPGKKKSRERESPLPEPYYLKYYQNSTVFVREWREKFEEKMKSGIMQDLWSPPPNLEVDSNDIEEFIPIDNGCRLPHGHFGMFPLVKYSKNGKFYRIKIHCKKFIRDSQVPKLTEKILTELQILANSDHAFIVELKGFFMDFVNIYVIMDDYRVGDLHSALLRSSTNHPGVTAVKILSEKEARFISSQIISALHYLHSVNVLHRDMKTSNILMGFDGYVALCDFGFSKYMRHCHRAYSLLGTWEFMAPEILRGYGYTYGADIWGFACIVHQLVAGCPPYKRRLQGSAGVHFAYRNLMAPNSGKGATKRQALSHEKYTWDEFDATILERQCQVSGELADLLHYSLRPDPYQRLGGTILAECTHETSGCGALEVMSHAWFRGVDFERLRQRQLPAPWKPQKMDYEGFVESDWVKFDIVNHVDPNNREVKPPERSVYEAD